ncbi:hypothetical protein MMC19_006845 [Ptychographa xylographoides]|nr:hypothetical protein [Ptychographa xylographoides]
MSNENSPPQTPTVRRASFAPGQRLSQLFSRSPGDTGGSTGIPPYPGPIAAAAANAQATQRRRMSISTLGLSGSPTQTSPFGSYRGRQESISSGGSGSPGVEESAIEEGDAAPINTPSTPFGRRMSFGAKALRDVRVGSGNNGRNSTHSASTPSAKGRGLSSSPETEGEASKHASNTFARRIGEGFNWSDQLRSRAQRSSSITGPPPALSMPAQDHQRAVSIATMDAPVKEIPKVSKAPDAFQERILKGDFYMD